LPHVRPVHGTLTRGGIVIRLLACLAVVPMAAWGAGALYYSQLPAPTLLAMAFGGGTVLTFILLPWRRALTVFLGAFAVLLVWWLRIPASNDRQWQPEVAVTPRATIAGEQITIHGVRNFDYRTETEFEPRWEDRTYDLNRLDAVDLVASYWAGPAIAHIFMSFGFEGEHVAMSVETRKEQHEQYSTIAGLFKQYELVYVVADERDVIRLRTTIRQPQEDVYIYRLRGRPDEMRRVFLRYVHHLNELHASPRFYNTLTTNCTTAVLFNARVSASAVPWTWKVLLSGHAPRYVYEIGRVDTSLPFEELQRRARVNSRAHAADRDPRFSERIRAGLPRPAPW
jgi:uncharacterized protein DUF4105